jgi:hypothetical protein
VHLGRDARTGLQAANISCGYFLTYFFRSFVGDLGFTPGPHFINERCFGEDFAIWLSERLQILGLRPSEPIQEDFGWVLLIPFQGRTFTLSIGIMDDSIGRVPSEWRVDVAFEKPLNGVRSWFRGAPSAELAQLAGILENSLQNEPRIQQVASEPS